MQVTTALSCWPEGIWRGTTFGERGQLLYVRPHLPCTRFCRVHTCPTWLSPPLLCLPQVVARRRRGGAALDFVLAPPRESVSLAARFDLNRMNLDPWLTVSLPDCHALRREGPSSSCASGAPRLQCLVRMPGDARARPQVVANEVLGPWLHRGAAILQQWLVLRS